VLLTLPFGLFARPGLGRRPVDVLQRRLEWALDLLSDERIRRQGYFNPGVVERLKRQYAREGFQLNPHLETDLLMVVLTFNLVLDAFQLPDLS